MSFLRLEALYKKHKQYLWNVFYKLTGDSDEAGDLLQKVFLKLAQMSDKNLDFDRINKTYLYKTGYSIFVNDIRKRKSEEEKLTNLALSTIENDFINDKDQFVKNIRIEIENLETSIRTKRILKMKLFGNLKAERIAEVLGISRRTIYRDLEEGLSLLKKKINESGKFNEEENRYE